MRLQRWRRWSSTRRKTAKPQCFILQSYIINQFYPQMEGEENCVHSLIYLLYAQLRYKTISELIVSWIQIVSFSKCKILILYISLLNKKRRRIYPEYDYRCTWCNHSIPKKSNKYCCRWHNWIYCNLLISPGS